MWPYLYIYIYTYIYILLYTYINIFTVHTHAKIHRSFEIPTRTTPVGSGRELPRSPRGSWPKTSPVGPAWPRDRPRRCRLSAADCCTRATSCWRWCQCPGKNHGDLRRKIVGSLIVAGWWFQPTPLKNDGVSWDDFSIPNMMGKS